MAKEKEKEKIQRKVTVDIKIENQIRKNTEDKKLLF